MGHVFRPLTTWSKYILTSDLAFEEYYGAKATKTEALQRSLTNRFIQYWGTRPPRKPRKTKKAGVKMKEAVFYKK